MSATLAPAIDRDKRRAAITRALDRAQAQAALGNVPTLIESEFDGSAIRETWIVRSRTERRLYDVFLLHNTIGVATLCPCAATGPCWHRAAARLAHQDAIPSQNVAGIRFRARRPA